MDPDGHIYNASLHLVERGVGLFTSQAGATLIPFFNGPWEYGVVGVYTAAYSNQIFCCYNYKGFVAE